MGSESDRIPRRWAPGDTVTSTTLIVDRPLWTIALTVVRDDPDGLALYRPAGTPYRELVTDDGRPLPRVMPPEAVAALSGRERAGTWEYGPSLLLTSAGASHTVILNWSHAWEFQRWYVNLERPLERDAGGVLVRDEFLDLVVLPDRTLTWKDEDEFARAVEVGRMDRERAVEVRREGERVAERAAAGEPPFDDRWVGWRPDPGWSLPVLPEG